MMGENTGTPNGQAPAETSKEPEVKHEAKKPKAAKAKAPKIAEGGKTVKVGPKDYDKYVLPEDESDPYWDAKMKLPVPDSIIESLTHDGWDETMAALVKVDAKGVKHLAHGRTRWRALQRANVARKKLGLEPIVALVVEEPEDDTMEGTQHTILRGMRLNLDVQKVDPMTLAEDIVRALSAGVEERVVARAAGITTNDLHGYLLLTDEDKCPPTMQELVREGHLSFTAALELARKSATMSKAELTAAAEQIAKVAAGGLRVTSNKVKEATGHGDEKVASKKEVKQFLLDIQSDLPQGKHGDQAGYGCIIGVEVAIGTRSIASAKAMLKKLAKGEAIKVNFSQYQDGNKGKSVKGQD